MHILFLTDNFPPEVNAPASRTYEHCCEWAKKGHKVTVITGAPNFPRGKVFKGYKNRLWQRETMAGIQVIRVWTLIFPNQGKRRRAADYLSYMISAILAAPFVRKVDIVIGTSPQFFTACAAYAVSCMKRVPYIFEVRDLWPASIKAVGAAKENKGTIGFLEKVEVFLYEQAAAVVTVTQSHKREVIARGIEPEKIAVITNGVSGLRFQPQGKNPELLKRYGLEGKFVAGYVGTHGMAHGLETLLHAAQKLQYELKDDRFKFLLLGDGANKQMLVEKAGEMQLENVVHVDTVPKEEVVRHWALLDVSVIHLKKDPLFRTVIPSKLFEAMGMGIPVLHGVEGESAEIVQNEGVGIPFEPENSSQLVELLRKLEQDSALYDELKENCLTAASRYDRTELANEMLEIIEQVVANGAYCTRIA